jgi:hypothetical protein
MLMKWTSCFVNNRKQKFKRVNWVLPPKSPVTPKPNKIKMNCNVEVFEEGDVRKYRVFRTDPLYSSLEGSIWFASIVISVYSGWLTLMLSSLILLILRIMMIRQQVKEGLHYLVPLINGQSL